MFQRKTSYKEVVEELQWISDRISTQVRSISLGLIIISWGLIIGQPQIAGTLTTNLKKNLLIIGVLALVTMFFDFLQYFFGYLTTDRLLNKMDLEKLDNDYCDYTTATYKLRAFFFWSKQILILVACVWFLVVIISFCIRAVLNSSN